MESIAILKIMFFLMWPLLIMGLIILIRKYRKNQRDGKHVMASLIYFKEVMPGMCNE